MVGNRCLKYIGVSLLLFSLFFDVKAQKDSIHIDSTTKRNYLKEFIIDLKDVALAPKRFNDKQWLTTGVFLGATSVIYSQDRQLNKFFQDNRTDFTDRVSGLLFDPWGDGYYSVPLVAGMFLYGHFNKKPREKRIAITTAKAMAVSAIYIYTMKKLFHRHRPNEYPADPYAWDGPSLSHDHDAFPSGHTVIAFTVASTLSSEYKDKPFIPITLYSLAGFTAASRLNDNKHWVSDVVVGGLLGYGIGKLVYNNDQKRIELSPQFTLHTYGLGLTYEFRN